MSRSSYLVFHILLGTYIFHSQYRQCYNSLLYNHSIIVTMGSTTDFTFEELMNLRVEEFEK